MFRYYKGSAIFIQKPFSVKLTTMQPGGFIGNFCLVLTLIHLIPKPPTVLLSNTQYKKPMQHRSVNRVAELLIENRVVSSWYCRICCKLNLKRLCLSKSYQFPAKKSYHAETSCSVLHWLKQDIISCQPKYLSWFQIMTHIALVVLLPFIYSILLSLY